MWGSVWGKFGECGKVCWGVRVGEGRCGEAFGVWGKIRGDVEGVKKCGRVYGVSVESVGKCVGCGEGEGEVWGVWGKVTGKVRVKRSVGECMRLVWRVRESLLRCGERRGGCEEDKGRCGGCKKSEG